MGSCAAELEGGRSTTPEPERTEARSLSRGEATLLLGLLLAIFAVVLIRTAWVCDDALVTARTSLNLLGGQGLTWNPGERVQAYTHPLWMLLATGGLAVTGEAYLTLIALSLLLSLGTALLLCRLAPDRGVAAFAVIGLLLSHAFIDYASSGLENPLTHVLLLGFALLYVRRPPHAQATARARSRTLLLLSLLAGAILLNRLDAGILVAPALLVAWLETAAQDPDWGCGHGRSARALLRALRPLLLGLAPLLAWELFALFYYGFPFPNTYYAKLHTGVSRAALVEQGLYYALNSLEADPLTLPVCLLGAAAPLVFRARRLLALSLGLLCYLAYVVRIGGDFMSGRFFAAPFLVGLALLLLCAVKTARVAWIAGVVGLAFSFSASVRPPLITLGNFGTAHGGAVDDRGISDERGYYFKKAGLIRSRRNTGMPLFGWSEAYGRILRERAHTQGREVVALGAIGVAGLRAGPHVHIVDPHALSDPLLARLPAVAVDRELQRWREDMASQGWRIGHFWRWLPPGYLETLRTGKDAFQDRGLALYYEKLSVLTRGPLLAPGRLREIWRFNRGAYDRLIDHDAHRYPNAARLTWSSTLAWPRKAGTRSDAPGTTRLTGAGAIIDLGARWRSALLELTLDGDDDYQLIWLRGREELGARELPGRSPSPPGLDLHLVDVPRRAVAQGYDRLVIVPLRGKGGYALGHLTPL